MKHKQELVNGHPAHWKILLSNILRTGRLSVFPVALSSCSTIVFHPCSAMGRGKQWSADTVREVKTLMNIGLALPRIPAQTGVVLQPLRSFSARTDEMRRWVSDYLLARPRASVSEVHVEFKKSGSDLSRSTLWRIMHSHRRLVKPIRTHKVRSVNCKRRVDFCIDMLSRFHQLQGVHRRIPVEARPRSHGIGSSAALLRGRGSLRCSQKLVGSLLSCCS